jgi:Uma2 family endonuclease
VTPLPRRAAATAKDGGQGGDVGVTSSAGTGSVAKLKSQGFIPQMTAAQKPRKWTIEEFFAWHERQEERYELVDGYPVLRNAPVRLTLPGTDAPQMMTGGNRQHNEVSAALLTGFRIALKGKPCRAYANDAAVRTSANQIRYPDLVVDCGSKVDEGYVFEHPVLVAEVLSPSTKSFDITGKMTEYWAIASLQYVLIADPETRRVQLHSRGEPRTPVLQVFDNLDQSIEFPLLAMSLSLADIFGGLPPAGENASPDA